MEILIPLGLVMSGVCLFVGVAHLLSLWLSLRWRRIDTACNEVRGWKCPTCGKVLGQLSTVVYMGRNDEIPFERKPFSFWVAVICASCESDCVFAKDGRSIRSVDQQIKLSGQYE